MFSYHLHAPADIQKTEIFCVFRQRRVFLARPVEAPGRLQATGALGRGNLVSDVVTIWMAAITAPVLNTRGYKHIAISQTYVDLVR